MDNALTIKANVELGHIDPEGLLALYNSPEMEMLLTSAAATINGTAIPYSGKFTGELDATMQYEVRHAEEGFLEATLGSGARDGNTVAQAAFNWYGHYDPDGIEIDPNYPRWEPHEGVKPAPSHPYENALKELGIPYEVESGQEWFVGDLP